MLNTINRVIKVETFIMGKSDSKGSKVYFSKDILSLVI